MKKVLRALLNIFLSLLLLICILVTWILKDDPVAVYVFPFLAALIGVCMWLFNRNRKEEAQPEKEQPRKEIWKISKKPQKPDKDELLCKGKFPILAGLPLPEGTKCKLNFLRSKVVIEALGQEFTLATEKLVDVSVMSRSEAQRHFVSSAGGAVAGAMLLGPVGALLGGGVKTKTTTQIHRFLIFAYKDANEENASYIIFQGWQGAGEFASAFKKIKKREGREKIRYEL